jgi:hypothetical protein
MGSVMEHAHICPRVEYRMPAISMDPSGGKYKMPGLPGHCMSLFEKIEVYLSGIAT